jgi:hypothetical protein
MRPFGVANSLLCFAIGGTYQLGFSQSPHRDTGTARITVVAVDSIGHPLSNTDVYSFVDERGKDRVSLFHHDSAAGLPYGKYRISVQANGGFRESTFDLIVSAPAVRVTVALEWYGVENVLVTGRFQGRIAGEVPPSAVLWCKASGLYTRDQFETEVSQTERAFDFGDVPPGLYILTCVADKKVVALEVLRISASTAPFVINYKPSQELENLPP